MKKIYYCFVFLSVCLGVVYGQGQQLPNSNFNDWSGEKFDGKEQPASWNYSNVTQFGFKFNFAHKETGRSGSCLMVQDQEIGAAGITEVSPGYVALGKPWVYIAGLTSVSSATAGTKGSISFKSRPDTMQVWIKRTGDNIMQEDFHLLFYSWKGTAKSQKYKGKNGNCTTVDGVYDDEESDIRQATDGNECGTNQYATQIAEGWWRERKEYAQWTQINVPILYMNNEVPEKCNVIFSASNYPNFRANSGLYAGNSLYIDDVKLIYSSKIQSLYIDGKQWKGFLSDSEEEQVYSLGEHATVIPEIYAVRGQGSLTNTKGVTTSFQGRRLTDQECVIVKGEIDKTPTTITVKAEDGSSQRVYKIKFVRAASTNTRLASIMVNGQELPNFNAYTLKYNYALPYGTKDAPVVTVEKAEDQQTVNITQPNGVNGIATIKVTAADKKTTATYEVQMSVKKLEDNTLQGIKVGGELLKDFRPTKTSYVVELPLETVDVPSIEPISAYAKGEQTIKQTNNGLTGTYTIEVSAPGNPTVRTYKLNFKITASSYVFLNNLSVEGYDINFEQARKVYYVTLPSGTKETELPKITWKAGDKYQTIQQLPTEEDEDGNLIVKIQVTAANGDVLTYKVIFTIERSEDNTLSQILLDGQPLEGFHPDQNTYPIELPVGTTTLPQVTAVTNNDYATATIKNSVIDEVTHSASCRITVTAENGAQRVYVLNYTIAQADNTTLAMIFVNGDSLPSFDPAVLTYSYVLPVGTKAFPEVTYTQHDEYQSVRASKGAFNANADNDYRIIVTSGAGTSATYTITFRVAAAGSNALLNEIHIGGEVLEGFEAGKTNYTVYLDNELATYPIVTATAQDSKATVQISQATKTNAKATVKVTAEDKKTTKTYTITFAVRQSDVCTLASISVNGQKISDFAPEQYEYSVELPSSTKQLTVTYEKGESHQKVAAYTESMSGLTGDYKLVVTAANGAIKTYILHFSLALSANATLNKIWVDGQVLANFAPNQFNYVIDIPQGTTVMPSITWEKGEEKQQVTFVDGGLNGTSEIIVVAEDGKTNNTYHLNFQFVLSSNTKLQMIYVDGVGLPGFTPEQTQYTYYLDSKAAQLPTVTYDKGEETQSVVARADEVVSLNGDYKLIVRAQSGDERTYVIKFEVIESGSISLDMIYLDGDSLPNFSATVFNYEVQLADAATSCPTITVDKSSTRQHVVITTPKLAGKATILVQSGSNQMTYTILFKTTYTPSDKCQLTRLQIGGEDVPGFNPNTYIYSQTLPAGTSELPTITYTADENTTVSVTRGTVEDTTYIRVLSEDQNNVSIYKIAFHVERDNDCFLQALIVNGEDILQPSEYDYGYVLPVGNGLTVEPVLKNAAQSFIMTRPLAEGQTTIVVIAPTGDKQTYSLTVTSAATSDAELQSISLNDVVLPDFDSQVTDYDITLPCGTKELPNITYQLKNEFQQVNVYPTSVNGTTTIRVTAQDGSVNEYHLQFTTPQEDIAALQMIYLDGDSLPNFAANQLTYTYILAPEDTVAPQVSAQATTNLQTVDISQPYCLGTATLKVWSESHAVSQTYTIVFKRNQLTDATLLDLKLNGETIDGFRPDSFIYHLKVYPEQVANEMEITYQVRDSMQSVILENNHLQGAKLIVQAEDGSQNQYRVTYELIQSSSALLDDIRLVSIVDEEVSYSYLPKFRKDSLVYTYSLPRHTTVVPAIYPVKEYDSQVVTIDYAAPNDTTKIHVLAEDGVTQTTYALYFPVSQSDNNYLESFLIDADVDFTFKPDITQYSIVLPDELDTVPSYEYTKADEDQLITLVAAPVDDTTRLTVKAENGQERTYSFYFYRKPLGNKNGLTSLSIKEGNQAIVLQKDVYEYNVTLPYGSKSMTVQYEKADSLQTVLVANGGIHQPTTLTVKSNRKGDEDVTYTITPMVETQNPAVLTGITIDGVALEDFDANRFSYVLNRTSATVPQVFVSSGSGVDCSPTTDFWSWTGAVTKDGYTNTYKIFFHYPNEVIPNGEFDQWTKQTVAGGDKPTHWNTPGDYVSRSNPQWMGIILNTSEPKDAVRKESASIVRLNTTNYACLAGPVPAVMNLGTMTANLAVAAGTRVTPSGSIGYHNTPDVATIRYKYPNKAGNGALIRFLFEDNVSQQHIVDLTQTSAISSYQERSIALNTSGKMITKMDIILDATGKYPDASSGADLYVDYIRFSYNSTLTGLKVNGLDATLTDTAFAVTLTDPAQTTIPSLAFTGEVSDQAQQITWQAEDAQGKRTATIRNFAEDGTYTDYTLSVTRPIDTNCNLKNILIGGASLSSFDPEQTAYEIHLTQDAPFIPDFDIEYGSSLQTATTTLADSMITIHVVAESGASKDYTVRYIKDMSNDATLQDVYGLTGFAPETFDYEVEAFANYVILKKFDQQQVTYTETATVRTINVISEDGAATGTYTIALKQTSTSTAQLQAVYRDRALVNGFSPDVYDYTIDKEEQGIAFVRQSANDEIRQVFEAQAVHWYVTASTASHEYTLQYTQPEPSSDASLQMIKINGRPLVDFDPNVDYNVNYQVPNEEGIQLTAIPNDNDQTLTMTYSLNQVTIHVLSANHLNEQTYTVNISRPVNSESMLQMIYLDNDSLPGFNPYVTNYDVELPMGSALPSIRILPGAPNQTYSIENNGMGGDIAITVKAQSGKQTVYVITTHQTLYKNTDLAAVYVNDSSILQPNRVVYDVVLKSNEEPQLSYYALASDPYQTVVLTPHFELDGGQDIITVTAENGDEKTYYINYSIDPSFFKADLQGMKLDDEPMANFRSDIYDYIIPVPAMQTTLPNMDAMLLRKEQEVTILPGAINDTTRLMVTAADGITTQTYSFVFQNEKSDDTRLLGISVDYQPITDFRSDSLTYACVSTNEHYTIQYVRANQTQRVMVLRNGNENKILVIAQDGSTRTYSVQVEVEEARTENAYLNGIAINGEWLSTFKKDSSLYRYTLPYGTTIIPDINVLKGDDEQQVVISMNQLSDPVSIISTAPDELHSMMYWIYFDLEPSTIDTLQMIYVNGLPVDDFAGSRYEYNVELPVGTVLFPAFEAVRGDAYQKEPQITVLSQTRYQAQYKITTTAQAGNHQTYYLTFTIAKSTEKNLKMIRVNNLPLSQNGTGYTADASFAPTTYTYHLQWAVGTKNMPQISYTAGDEYEQVTILNTLNSLNDSLFIRTVSENLDTATYVLYNELLHSDCDTLKMIYVNDLPLEDFEAQRDSFTYLLPVGTTAFPTYEVVRGNEWQQISEQRSVFGNEQTITFLVTAEDGVHQRSYTLRMIIVPSDIATLSEIRVNGLELSVTDEGFEADAPFDENRFRYHLTWNVGTTQVPEFSYELTDTLSKAVVVCTPYSLDDSLVVRVVAQSGKEQTYTVTNTLLHSDCDTLQMIYLDGKPLTSFQPEILTYDLHLPVGTRQWPNISFEQGDVYQQCTIDTLFVQAYMASFQIRVIAEDGTHKKVYALNFDIKKDTNSHLESILVDNMLLPNFDAHVLNYTYTVDATAAGQITYEKGSAYQTVTEDMHGLDSISRLVVTAEDGSQTTYTVELRVKRSANTSLDMIYYDGVAVPNFDAEEDTSLTVNLRYGTIYLPEITVVKHEPTQTVLPVEYDVKHWTARVTVIAEDGIHQQTYTIRFVLNRCGKDVLEQIRVNDIDLADFESEKFEYTVELAENTTQMPSIKPIYAERDSLHIMLERDTLLWQDMIIVTSDSAYYVNLGSTLPLESYSNVYLVQYVIQARSENRLCDLQVDGLTIAQFDPDKFEYDIDYPMETDSAAFITRKQIKAIPMDSLATVTIDDENPAMIVITVTAQNGQSQGYFIFQSIACNPYLEHLWVDSVDIKNFDPFVFVYEYILPQGVTTVPLVDAIAQDSTTEVSITYGELDSIPTYIYCDAPDGSSVIYMIYFRSAEFNSGQKAQSTDVIFRHIAGTNQYFAATIRNDVQLAIYTLNGQPIIFGNVPVCNPNDATVYTDVDGVERLDAVDNPYANGLVVTLTPNEIYLYAIYEMSKNKLTSGKIYVTP